MREIKFRAWDKAYKQFQEGDIIRDNIIGEFVDDPEFEVSQYTGLKDKNGKEIYEGDIVRFKAEGLSGLGVVYWKNDVAQFWIRDIRLKTNKRGERHYPFYENARYRVDSNIYENPELIQGSDEE